MISYSAVINFLSTLLRQMKTVEETNKQQSQLLAQAPYKQSKPLDARKQEAAVVKAKHPRKIPVILERFAKEKALPQMDKLKFLVPEEIAVSQFVNIVRSRLSLSSSQAFYLLINNKTMPSMSLTMGEVYRNHRDIDGFLYVTYASQETFGC